MDRTSHFTDAFSTSRQDVYHSPVVLPPTGPKQLPERPSAMGGVSIPGNSMGAPAVEGAQDHSAMGAWSTK